jgi:hypothetical protein
MPRRHVSNAIIARIRILGWSDEDAMHRIRRLIGGSSKVRGKRGGFDWVFGDCEDVTSELPSGEPLFFARLGKVRHGLMETFYDEKKKSFIRQELALHQAAYSNFMIYPKKHLIVFEEKLPYISIGQFVDAFRMIYNHTNSDLSDIRIEPLSEPVQTMKMIRSYDKIIEVDFDLVTSNPDDSEDFRILDNLLKEARSADSKLKLRNESETGLNIDSKLIKAGFSLGAKGYGEFTVRAVKGGAARTFKSRDKIIRLCIEVADDPVSVARGFYLELLKKLRE